MHAVVHLQEYRLKVFGLLVRIAYGFRHRAKPSPEIHLAATSLTLVVSDDP